MNIYQKNLEYALAFTDAYRSEADKASREAKCLAMQIPYVLQPIGKEDLVVGLMKHGYVGFSPQWGGTYTWYFHEEDVRRALNALEGEADAEYREKVNEMCIFWQEEQTQSKVRKRYHEKYPEKINSLFFYNVCRVAGLNVDLGLLLRLGLDGLRERNRHFRSRNGDSAFYDALDTAVDLLSGACIRYADEADALCGAARGTRASELREISGNLRRIATQPPGSFKEALQLLWIYAVCTDLMNYGRMDNYLGEFYARDIDSGRLSEDEAIRWLSSLYRNIIKIGKIHDSRIIIGGEGRRNTEAADRLALTLIQVSRQVADVVPQLTLRYYKGMDERLLRETMRNIAGGAVYPIVYSDEATLPAIEHMYRVGRDMACNWVPFGCGEYVMEGYGVATPNSIITLPLGLDLVLHGGVDSFYNVQVFEDMEDPVDFETFEDLFAAYDRLMRYACERMAYHDELNYKIAGEEACYLLASLLLHDSVERGVGMFNGGVRFLASTSEVFGLITCADSLTAIKKYVYDDKLFTLKELIAMLDANFKGFTRERNLLLNAPKYGNDDDEADAMAVRVFTHIAGTHESAAADGGLYLYKMCSVNNSGSTEFGLHTAATPCGRLRGTALSNGNSPSIGADKHGLTAALNSMAKMDNRRHVGVVHNLRFNRDLLVHNQEKILQTLETFFDNNGSQANLSAVGKDDLEQALLRPELYKNLIVRIGGFSARFVELNPALQKELVERTTYEAG
ncbi:MAG: hypothetical protein LBU32_31855 [Clostridiales bacterium]|jgi:pyruvate-formate lyase|nr:hypothetical protein [Clostridiales bacterium]